MALKNRKKKPVKCIGAKERPDTVYTQVKDALIASLQKQDSGIVAEEPDTALDVMDAAPPTEKVAEQAFVAEHLFRRAIEDVIPAGIGGYDLAGRQIYLNQAFCDMFGWEKSELIGCLPPFPYWPEEGAAETSAGFHLLLAESKPSEGLEMRFRKRNGEIFWGLVSGADLCEPGGNKIGSLISVVDITKRKRVEKTLRALSSRLLDAQETERKLVARDLHDSIGGKLAGIKYSLEKIVSDTDIGGRVPTDKIRHLVGIVARTIEESQRISRNLHPSLLDDLGLLSALRAFCREFQKVYTNIHVDVQLDINEAAVPEDLKIILYRILQEALNNVAKHSGATAVTVRLSFAEGKITLIVGDNGCGFNTVETIARETNDRGLGIASMAERAEFSGGTFQIDSAPGRGTIVRASWP